MEEIQPLTKRHHVSKSSNHPTFSLAPEGARKLHAFPLSVDGTLIICNPSERNMRVTKIMLNKYRKKTRKLSKSELFAFVFKLINSFVDQPWHRANKLEASD